MRHLVLLSLAVLLPPSLRAQERTRSPHGDLKLQCATCHRSDGWKEIRINPSFDHAKFGFPLTGAHGAATCRACHLSLDFTGVKQECASCHKDVHRGELGPDCSRCHTSRDFQDRDAMLRVHQLTRFRLDGAHRAVDCYSCHTPAGQGQLQFVARSADCVSCHEADYVRAKDPDHVASGIPRDCVNCHPTSTWSRGKFNHDASAFPLTGAHRAVACAQCHTNGGYRGLSADCVQCHQDAYNTATPNHQQAQFPTDCRPCHSTTAWSPASFNHNATRFPLTGTHRTTACADCHKNGVYTGTPTACVPCHQIDYNNATTPQHTPASFPLTCATCHTTTVWTGASFTHSWFPRPHHGIRDCADCHANPADFTAFTCTSCHTHDKATADSQHRNRTGYSWDSAACLRCHPNGSGD